MLMRPLIGIIGGRGKTGSQFSRFFRKSGLKVLIVGRYTKLTKEELAAKCDIVIVSVPISKTVQVIKELTPYVRKAALLTDFTSLKVEPMKAMMRAKAEVMGLHPMFGPSVKSLKGQAVVICLGKSGKWSTWMISFLKRQGAKASFLTPVEHDRTMAIIQGIVHFGTIVLGNTLRESKVNIGKSLKYTSPVYRLELDLIGRIFAQDPELYADIEMNNKDLIPLIDKYIKMAKKVKKAIKSKDKKAFTRLFEETSKFLGEFKKDAMKESDSIISFLASRR